MATMGTVLDILEECGATRLSSTEVQIADVKISSVNLGKTDLMDVRQVVELATIPSGLSPNISETTDAGILTKANISGAKTKVYELGSAKMAVFLESADNEAYIGYVESTVEGEGSQIIDEFFKKMEADGYTSIFWYWSTLNKPLATILEGYTLSTLGNFYLYKV